MSTKATVAEFMHTFHRGPSSEAEKLTIFPPSVFYGFYHFLDQHPSETLFISVKVDVGTNDAALQAAINSLQTTGVGRDFCESHLSIPQLLI